MTRIFICVLSTEVEAIQEVVDVCTFNLRTFAFIGEDDVALNVLEVIFYVIIADVNYVFCLSSFVSSLTGLLVLKLCGKVYFI